MNRDVRADFPVLSRVVDGNPVVYLDSAATSLKPTAVIEAIVEYYSRISANIHRGKHYLSEEASTRFEEARAKVARFVGCMSNELVFTRNTTEALCLVASGLGLAPGDTVVGSLDAHHSQLLPWRSAAQLSLAKVDGSGRVDLEHFAQLLRARPRVVAITHCSNVTGFYAPIEQMVRMAREAGAVTVLDAAQSIPHRRIDVRALGVDFVAFSGHKMLGPTGIGVLYGRGELLERLRPALLGGGTVDWVDLESHKLRKVPHRFEAGTPHIAGVLGLGAAVDYLQRLGAEEIREHDASLCRAMLAETRKRDYLEVIAPERDQERAALVSMRVKGCRDLSDIARMLSDSYGIMCRTGHHCAQPLVDALSAAQLLRASAYVYNTPEEVTQLFQALDEIKESLGI